MSEEKINLPAYAKINLGLRVRGRRADGYHEIETTFQTITLHDNLTFESRPDEHLTFFCSDTDIPTDESNLVVRAAIALRERFGTKAGAYIELEKTIPAGSGLGGGSSDAAVSLIALARLWKIKVTKDDLCELGARLGADVPFFLTGGTAFGSGTGADISPLEDSKKMHLVVVTPCVRVSTVEAYKLLNAPALTKDDALANLSVSRTVAEFYDSPCDVIRNDFESVVVRLQPEIRSAREALNKTGANRTMLSGSGSSLFGVFESEGEAERARDMLSAERRWQVFACATLSRAEYIRGLGGCAAILQSSRGA